MEKTEFFRKVKKKSLFAFFIAMLLIPSGLYLRTFYSDFKIKETINKVSPIAKKVWSDSSIYSSKEESIDFDVKTTQLSSDSTVAANSIINFAKKIKKSIDKDQFEFTITSLDDSGKTVQITHGSYKGDDQVNLYTTIPKDIAKKSGMLNYKGTDDYVPYVEMK